MTKQYKTDGVLKIAQQLDDSPVIYAVLLIAIWAISSSILYEITANDFIAGSGGIIVTGAVFLSIDFFALKAAIIESHSRG